MNHPNRNLKSNIVKICVGIFMIIIAVLGYKDSPQYMYELTFLSNFSCGILLFVDGVIDFITKKSLPVILYQLVLPCITVVFCTVVFELFGWHSFNFSGFFLFMHAINPIAFLTVYLFCTRLKVNSKKEYLIRIFVAPSLVMAYALFDLIRFCVTGKLVYGLLPTDYVTWWSVILIGIGLYALIAFMCYGYLDLKLFVQKQLKER